MARNRSDRVRVRDLIAYVGFRAALAAALSLGLERAGSVARAAARLFYFIDRRRRRIAASNLAQALPELDASERERIARASLESFAVAMVESIYMNRVLGRTSGRWRLTTEGMDEVQRAAGDGALIFVTAHLGNWEVGGATLGLLGFPLNSVVRTLDSPLIQKYAERQRSEFGQRLVPKRGGIRQVMKVLREGGNLGIVADQDAGRHGVYAQYFGRPASTFPTPALVALRYGCPIVTGAFVRTSSRPFEFCLILDGAVEYDMNAERESEILRVTQRINDRLERYVRAYPEQYLWQHRRWKTQPAEEGATQARLSRKRETLLVEST